MRPPLAWAALGVGFILACGGPVQAAPITTATEAAPPAVETPVVVLQKTPERLAQAPAITPPVVPAPAPVPTDPTGAPTTPVTPPLPASPATPAAPDSPAPPAGSAAPIVPTAPPASPNADGATGDEGIGGNFSFETPGGSIYNGERGVLAARGPVVFRYRQLTVRGDRFIYDEKTHRAILTGHLTVTVLDRVFNGKTIVFDTNTGRWTLSNVERVFSPAEFPYGTVLEPVYVKGAAVTGSYDQVTNDITNVHGSNFKFTSCDRDHYYLLSKRLDFYRDAQGEPSRIVLHNNALYILGHRIVPLPVFVIDLQSSQSRRIALEPTVGQNPIDGFFVRTLYDLAANAHHTDSLLIDALQKRGLGLGFSRELANGAGLFYLYGLSGRTGLAGREVDSRIRHFWKISPTLNSTVNFQSTQNSFLGVGAARNGDLSFNRSTGRAQSGLFLRFSETSNAFSTFSDEGVSLNHAQDFGAGFHLDASSVYSTSQTTGIPETKTLDNLFTLTRRGHLADATLRTELHDDLTGRSQVHGAYQLERLPELELTSSPAADRLNLPFLKQYLPGEIMMGLGEYNEPSSTQHLTRTEFAYNTTPPPIPVAEFAGLRTTLNTLGRFEQAFYSDNTARYNYDYSLELVTGPKTAPANALAINPTNGPIQGNPLFNSVNPGAYDPTLNAALNAQGRVTVRLNYYKQRMVGFTPFQFDFISPTESVAGTATLAPASWVAFNLSAGRDLQNSFSNDIIAGVQLKPLRSIYASLTANYSPQTHLLGDIIGRLHIQRDARRILGGTTELDMRYSSPQAKVTQANVVTDLLVTRKTRFQTVLGYNGFTRQFDLAQFRITQDLHCVNLYVSYDSQTREFRMDLAIKAFPFLDTRLGMTQQGTGFDPYIGGVH